MYIAYYDETGDDGFGSNSPSPLFVLTALYLHHLKWKEIYQQITEFRKRLKNEFKIPVKTEFHTKKFVLNKKPYLNFNLSTEERIKVINLFCDFIKTLDLKFINVVINKQKIRKPDYKVLDWALTFSIQRIENDLNQLNEEEKFLIITDEGRIGKMRETSRRMQKINNIPSKFNSGTYPGVIQNLIEDPIGKNSRESYFIQLADFVSYIVYIYELQNLKAGKYPNRFPKEITKEIIEEWMDTLQYSFNLKATKKDRYGIVIHPK